MRDLYNATSELVTILPFFSHHLQSHVTLNPCLAYPTLDRWDWQTPHPPIIGIMAASEPSLHHTIPRLQSQQTALILRVVGILSPDLECLLTLYPPQEITHLRRGSVPTSHPELLQGHHGTTRATQNMIQQPVTLLHFGTGPRKDSQLQHRLDILSALPEAPSRATDSTPTPAHSPMIPPSGSQAWTHPLSFYTALGRSLSWFTDAECHPLRNYKLTLPARPGGAPATHVKFPRQLSNIASTHSSFPARLAARGAPRPSANCWHICTFPTKKYPTTKPASTDCGSPTWRTYIRFSVANSTYTQESTNSLFLKLATITHHPLPPHRNHHTPTPHQ
jgi:hypothetical protein